MSSEATATGGAAVSGQETVRFTVTEEDLYWRAHYGLTTEARPRQVLAVLAGTVLFLTPLCFGLFLSRLQLWLLELTVAAALILLYRWGLRWFVYQRVKASSEPLETVTVTISPEGVRVVTPSADWTVDWSSFSRIERRGNYFRFRLNQDLTVEIPRRAFANATDAESFLAKAQFWRAEYRPAMTVPTADGFLIPVNPDTSPHDLAYQLHDEDVYQFSHYCQKQDWRGMARSVLTIVVAGVIVTLTAKSSWLLSAGIVLAVTPLLIPLRRWSLRGKVAAMIQETPDMLGPSELSISREGLRTNSTHHPWRAFHKIVEVRGYLYFLLMPDRAIIVPDRAFRSPEERAQFLTTARDWYAAAMGFSR